MKTSEILYKAADQIRAHGWTRGDYIDDSGQLCMLGACAVAQGLKARHFYGGPATPAFYQRLVATLGIMPSDFNDRHCKTADDAIAALEIAADIACAEGK